MCSDLIVDIVVLYKSFCYLMTALVGFGDFRFVKVEVFVGCVVMPGCFNVERFENFCSFKDYGF